MEQLSSVAQAVAAAVNAAVKAMAQSSMTLDAHPASFPAFLESESRVTPAVVASEIHAHGAVGPAAVRSGGKIERMTLCDAADAVARGDLRSEQLTQHAIDRLQSIGPQLNCVVALYPEEALEAARAIDRDRAAGVQLGPLGGIPMAHKDLFYRRGRVCESGSRVRQGFRPDGTATVLERMDAAGAIDLGRLQMAEFALSPTGFNAQLGHVRNPWSLDHVPGGSSSGSGAAVAARLVFGSLGTDTGGSIRHPAAMCGITGIKPTWSRVSRAGVMPLSFSLDCVGPLARTARDCARLLSVIAGPDPRDPTASARACGNLEAQLDGDIRGLRVAVPRGYYEQHLTSEVAAALAESLSVLRHRGALIIETRTPDMGLINAMMGMLMASEASAIHHHWLTTRGGDYSPQVRNRIEPGFLYPVTSYLQAQSLRAHVARQWLNDVMTDADVVHLPALSIPVPSIAQTTEGSEEAIAAVIAVITHCTRGINLLGLPSAAVPAGFVSGRPTAFQLVGRPFAEASVLKVADAYQRETDWHERIPDLAI